MDPEHFLEQFFGDANRFSYDSVREGKGDTYESIQRWASSLVDSGEPVVLPCWRDNRVVWYGIAQTDRQAQRLIEEVSAFVGPSYSTFTGERARLDRENPIEQAVEAFTGGKAIKFIGRDKSIRQALDRMHEVRERKEPHQQAEDLGVGLILRRFSMALRARNRDAAEEYLGSLRERDLLSVDNLRYLQVRMLAAFDEWDELLEWQQTSEIIQQKDRPLRVTRALIQAVYNTQFLTFEEQNDPEGAVEHFVSSVLPEYGDLFAVRSSMQAPEVLKSFMMRAVGEEENYDNLRVDLQETAERVGLDDPFFDAIAALGEGEVTPRTVDDPLEEAMMAWSEGRSDEAFQLLQDAEASRRKARLLIPLVGTLQSLDVESELAGTLAQLDEPERQDLIQKHEVCRRLVGSGGPPSNWRAWFEAIAEDRYSSSEEALMYAEKLAEEWSPKHLLDTSGALHQLTQSLENAPLSGSEGRTVSRALPALLRALQNDPEYPRSTFQDVYRAVQARIPYVDDPAQSDFDVYLNLSEIRLEYGVTEEGYREVTDGAIELWNEEEAPHRINWLLDFAELLALTSARDEEAQLRFLTTVVEAIQKYRNYVEPAQVKLFRRLCEDIGHPDLGGGLKVETDEEGDAEPEEVLCRMLSGQTLGIYTLRESAGRRVKSFLEERCAGVTIHLRHDKEGNQELHQVAENADYFLVVTRSAKHAATDVIDQHIPTERLIRPKGKGESSMIRDLVDYAKKEEEVSTAPS